MAATQDNMTTPREFTCAICGRVFSKVSLRLAKYCSEQCRNKAALLSKKRRRERQDVKSRENKSQREYRQRYATEASKYDPPARSRRCHDCGRPTDDYRCPECLRKWRLKNHVMLSVDG